MLGYLLLSYIFLLPAVTTKLLPLPDELSSRRSLSRCVSDVIKGLDYGETVSVSLYTKPPSITRPSAVALEQIMLEDIFAAGNVAIVTEKADDYVKCVECSRKVAGYVIMIREIEEVVPSLILISTQKHWNPHAHFLIISTSIFDYKYEALARIVEDLAHFKVINVLILIPRELESVDYNVYSWYPYSNGKCGDDYNVKEIGLCKNGTMSNLNLFKNKIPRNLNGCTVKIRTSIIEPFIVPTEPILESRNVNLTEGLEIKLMNTIAELRNLTFVYSLTEVPNFYGAYSVDDDVFSGSFFDLQQEIVDILLGYVVSRPETRKHFDPISAYYQDSLIICVPHAERLKDWQQLTNDFDISAVVIFLVIGATVTILIRRIAKYQAKEFNIYKDVWLVAANIFRSTFGITIKMPKTWKLRLLILCWVIFCYHTHIAYQSTLISSLSRHRYSKQISTIEELAENGLIIQYYPICARFYNASAQPTKKLIRSAVCNGIQKCVNRTANDRGYAVCAPKLNVQYLMSNYVDENSDPQIYCLNEIIASYPIEMLLWKGHPLKASINDLVHQISQSGFFDKWQRDIFYNGTRSIKIKSLLHSDETGLTLQHLGLVFVITAVGLSVSGFIFALECIVHHFRN